MDHHCIRMDSRFTLQDKSFEASDIVTSDLKVEVILGVDFL